MLACTWGKATGAAVSDDYQALSPAHLRHNPRSDNSGNDEWKRSRCSRTDASVSARTLRAPLTASRPAQQRKRFTEKLARAKSWQTITSREPMIAKNQAALTRARARSARAGLGYNPTVCILPHARPVGSDFDSAGGVAPANR